MSIAESEERETGHTVQAMRKRNGQGRVTAQFRIYHCASFLAQTLLRIHLRPLRCAQELVVVVSMLK